MKTGFARNVERCIASTGVAAFLAVGLAAAGSGGGAETAPATRPTIYAVVFDFASTSGAEGAQLADSVRLGLRGDGEYDVLDRLSTQEASGPLGKGARGDVLKLMDRLAANLAVYGTVTGSGKAVRAEIHCIDATGTGATREWAKVFTDDTERARGVIARKIVEAVRGRAEWTPPQYGDEAEPNAFAAPLNANGGFESGHFGWDSPDNVSTFIERGDAKRGKILRIRTDLARDPWLAYRRGLMFGHADANRPPKIERDTTYGSVAGLEGVHFAGEWIKATPGRRYWLVADFKGATRGMFFPKIFVKGFRRTPHALDGLPERSLVERRLTPQDFAALSPEERKKLIAEDAAAHPMRYLRECYRWYLACRNSTGAWAHYAAPFPPLGGLPANVEWLQIQIYAYWPPGEYLFDDVHMYPDPRQKAPLPEVKPRTPHFGKTSDVVEKATTRPAE